MSRPDEDLREAVVELRLLDEVCQLVRSWEGQPPAQALDAVLAGTRRPVVVCSPVPRRRPRAPGRRRPGGGGADRADPVRRVGRSARP